MMINFILDKIVMLLMWIASCVDLDTVQFILSVAVYLATSYLPIFIAGCVLAVTIVQGWQNHKHNKLSVKPLLRTPRLSITKKGLTNAKIRLINSGVGPAIIENFVLLFDGEEKSRNGSKTYKKFLREDMQGFNCIVTTHRGRNSVIGAGEELVLCEFEYIDKIKNDKTFNKLRFQIDYYSIYKDELFTYPLPKIEEECPPPPKN